MIQFFLSFFRTSQSIDSINNHTRWRVLLTTTRYGVFFRGSCTGPSRWRHFSQVPRMYGVKTSRSLRTYITHFTYIYSAHFAYIYSVLTVCVHIPTIYSLILYICSLTLYICSLRAGEAVRVRVDGSTARLPEGPSQVPRRRPHRCPSGHFQNNHFK